MDLRVSAIKPGIHLLLPSFAYSLMATGRLVGSPRIGKDTELERSGPVWMRPAMDKGEEN
jgi:hypothetical protein